MQVIINISFSSPKKFILLNTILINDLIDNNYVKNLYLINFSI
jgi:hypothetical protein